MNCDDVQPRLFDLVDQRLDRAVETSIFEHLADCETCSTELASIRHWQLQATVWHDVQPPRWTPPRLQHNWSRGITSSFVRWFPVAASASALALAIVALTMFWRMPSQNLTDLATRIGRIEAGQSEIANAGFDAFSRDWAAREGLVVESILRASETKHDRELATLVKLLKAKMDRQALETEESLRYVIAHQIQGQERLEQLADHVRTISHDVPPSSRAGGEL
ncbi:MAG: hypothetical protein O7H39_20500 [Gammaproteobacteria bacterium]|nr:hypothetical protein [Gammaproteobacteria bacterium]